jgi:hypothetical protein
VCESPDHEEGEDDPMDEKGRSGGLGVLAQEVPFAHHANSTIVCRITGKIMNEDNPPLTFDNGNVFSTEVGLFLRNVIILYVTGLL